MKRMSGLILGAMLVMNLTGCYFRNGWYWDPFLSVGCGDSCFDDDDCECQPAACDACGSGGQFYTEPMYDAAPITPQQVMPQPLPGGTPIPADGVMVPAPPAAAAIPTPGQKVQLQPVVHQQQQPTQQIRYIPVTTRR